MYCKNFAKRAVGGAARQVFKGRTRQIGTGDLCNFRIEPQLFIPSHSDITATGIDPEFSLGIWCYGLLQLGHHPGGDSHVGIPFEA